VTDSKQRVTIRQAQRSDAGLVLQFIRGLAEYERLAHECEATLPQIEATLFGENPSAEVIMAFCGDAPAGFALFFRNYSTFLAKPGLYLEDLYVEPAFRGMGVGQQLLAHLAGIAVQRGYGRFEWSVLDWNENAIRFYERLGARPMNDWTVFRVTGPALTALAATSAGTPT
jgi:GNAT superfamily N-acetyltransferase